MSFPPRMVAAVSSGRRQGLAWVPDTRPGSRRRLPASQPREHDADHVQDIQLARLVLGDPSWFFSS